jgi:hypothetical protein
MKNIEKFYWVSIFIILQAIGTYSYYEEIHKEGETQCGVVIDKFQDNESHKHKSNVRVTVEEYFVVRYQGGGVIKHNVNSNTYYNHEINDTVCFQKRIEHKLFYNVFIGIGTLVLIIDIFLCVAFVCFILFVYLVDKIRGKDLKYFCYENFQI